MRAGGGADGRSSRSGRRFDLLEAFGGAGRALADRFVRSLGLAGCRTTVVGRGDRRRDVLGHRLDAHRRPRRPDVHSRAPVGSSHQCERSCRGSRCRGSGRLPRRRHAGGLGPGRSAVCRGFTNASARPHRPHGFAHWGLGTYVLVALPTAFAWIIATVEPLALAVLICVGGLLGRDVGESGYSPCSWRNWGSGRWSPGSAPSFPTCRPRRDTACLCVPSPSSLFRVRHLA